MPIGPKRKLTPEELASFGVAPDASADQTTTSAAVPSAHEGRTPRGKYSWIPATAVRLGSGILSSEGLWTGAGIAGGGEILAQKIESADPVDKGAIAIESGLGAIPFSKILRGIKPGLSLGKTAIANAARMAGFTEVGNMARRFNKEGHILPQSSNEALWDLGTMGAGATLGGAVTRFQKPAQEAAKAAEAVPVADKFDEAVEGMASKPVTSSDQTVPVRLGKQGTAGSGLGGLRVKPNTPPVKAVTREAGASLKDYLNPAPVAAEVQGSKTGLGGARVEDMAPKSGGVELEQAEILRKRSAIRPEMLDATGHVNSPEAALQAVDEGIDRTNKLAKVQRMEHRRTIQQENAVKRAEQTADVQNARVEAGGTDLRTIEQKAAAQAEKAKMQDANQQARNLNAKDKAATQMATDMTKQVRTAEAQKKIDDMIASGTAEVGPRVLTETTEKVPTASGNQTMRQTIVEKLKDEIDPSAIDADFQPGPGPAPTKTPVLDIPITDPNIVSKTTYPTEKAVMDAIAGSGRRATRVRLGRGKWVAKFEPVAEDAEKVAAAVPEPPVAPPIEGKGEAPPVVPEAPVEAPKALPEPSGAKTGEVLPAQNPNLDRFGIENHELSLENNTPAERDFINGITPKVGETSKISEKELGNPADNVVATQGEPPQKGLPKPPPAAEPPAPLPAKPKGPKPKPSAGGATAAAPIAEAKMSPEELDKAVADELKKWTPDQLKSALAKGKITGPYSQKFSEQAQSEITRRSMAKVTGTPAANTTLVKADKPVAPIAAKPGKVATSQNPEGIAPERLESVGNNKVVDLTGAQTGTEVRNRLVNELQSYSAEVKAARDAGGINEKGESTVVLPKPKTIHVPGGPSITVTPDQVDNLIERLDRGMPKNAEGAAINPEEAFNGIVNDATPRPTHVTVSTGYGTKFGAKDGNSPAVKLPIAFPKKAEATTARSAPATAAILNDSNKTLTDVDKSLAKTKEGPATPAAPLAEPSSPDLSQPGKRVDIPLESPKANIKADVNDLTIARKEAADKYFELKQSGTASKEDIRAAGKAYGEADHALAQAHKDAGTSIPPVEKPAAPVKPAPLPKGKGPLSSDLASMPPEEQDKAISEAVSAFKKLKKGKGGSEAGFNTAEALTKVGLGSIGAVTGAASMPDDPLTGALLGFGAGIYAPTAFRQVMAHLNSKDLSPEVEAASKQKLGEWVWDKVQTFMNMLPDYYRASSLSSPPGLLMNSLAGPYGSMVMGAIEHQLAGDARGGALLKRLMSPEFFKDYMPSILNRGDMSRGQAWREAAERINEANERAGGSIGQVGPKWFRKTTSIPAQFLTAGDIAARRLAMNSGFSELEARQINLTSEPVSGISKALGNFLKTKGPHGNQSWIARMMLPFYRTNANQLEQSALRVPIVGQVLRKYWKLTPINKRLQIVQNAMSLGTAGTSYALGSVVPPENQKNWLKFLSNFGGVYGTTMAMAFVAGAANQQGSDAKKQIAAAATRLVGKDMPLPSADIALSVIKAFTGDPQLPYGAVPPLLSSKQAFSLPTLIRGENPFDNNAKVTKNELSLYAPFANNPELKKQPKPLSSSQKAVERQKALYAKYKKSLKKE